MNIKLIAASAVLAFSGSAAAVPVILDLLTDSFGNETSFTMTLAGDSNNIAYDSWSANPSDPDDPIFLGDGEVSTGDLLSETIYVFNWDLGAGDYEFTIFDSAGDGLCCAPAGAWLNGDYFFDDGTGFEFFSGEFTDSETIAFTIAPAPVAEPGMLALLGLGLLGLAAARRK